MTVPEFFSQYQNAFNNKNVTLLGQYYFLPTVSMNSDEKLIFMRIEQVEDYLHQLIEEFQQKGVVRAEADVRQVMKLAKNIMFCNVEWSYFNEENKNFMFSQVSYTLQLEEGKSPQIIAIVRDREPERRSY